MTHHPTAHVTRIKPVTGRPDLVAVRVRCPHCGDKHTHRGYADQKATGDYGHRAAHCGTGRGYLVRDRPRGDLGQLFTWPPRKD
ncbi:hypothetical protein ACWDTD_01490 [Gordonia sp. NPDC003425]